MQDLNYRIETYSINLAQYWISKNNMLSGASRDGGPTASTSQSSKLPTIVVQKCMRCNEEQESSGLERKKKTLRWLLRSPEATMEVADQNEPEIALLSENKSNICKHHD